MNFHTDLCIDVAVDSISLGSFSGACEIVESIGPFLNGGVAYTSFANFEPSLKFINDYTLRLPEGSPGIASNR
jgi:hypothetical protein